MPNFSGLWTVTQQMQARGASTWPATPGAPTIGTATAGVALCASVTFTAPGCTGAYPAVITGYRVVSTPGCVTATGASSPLVVTGLTAATSYTFKAQATNANGYGALSAASNSITATLTSCATYTTAGTFSWVAPSGVTSVAVVAIGLGGNGSNGVCCCGIYYYGRGGGSGGLGYKNSIAVTPGNAYTVRVYSGCVYNSASYFINCSTVAGLSGKCGPGGGCAGGYVGTGGAFGGTGGNSCYGHGGGAGAGGYSGAGGRGGGTFSSSGVAGTGGSGGGGNASTGASGRGGGGVGLLGQGANGAANGGGGSGGASTTSVIGGAYGGGGAGGASAGSGGASAVRIVWCSGGARGTPSFPSTNVGA